MFGMFRNSETVDELAETNTENIKSEITSDFLQTFKETPITRGTREIPGVKMVANKLMSLLPRDLGVKHSFIVGENFPESKLLDILNGAGVTKDDITELMESSVGDWNEKTEYKPTLNEYLDKHEELQYLKVKIENYLASTK